MKPKNNEEEGIIEYLSLEQIENACGPDEYQRRMELYRDYIENRRWREQSEVSNDLVGCCTE